MHQLDAAWLSRPWDEVRPPLHPFAPAETRVQKKGANVRPLTFVPRRASPCSQDRLDRISAGLFRGDERGERVSTAAVRLAFCHHEASRRWLAEQESRLLSSRIRLGETSLADVERATAEMNRHDANDADGSYSRALFGTPPPPEANHRWIPFERAAPLLRRRDVQLCRGWASVPEARMRDVLIAAYADTLVKELETTRRRLAHVHTAAVGSSAGFGSPGLGACLLELARWRPGEGEYQFLGRDDEDDRRLRSSSARAGAGDVARGRIVGGGADEGADGGADWGADGAAFNFEGGATGGRGQWRRGWRRKTSKDRRSRGGSDPVIASSLPAGLHVRPPTRASDGPYGRLPTGPWTVELGPDAKRVLRVLRRGVKGVAARPYPPCMRRHLQTLHRERHLKHHSRWQLTLFLKGVDMSVDEALAVWRSQFPHGKMADFQREHTYAVRHSFGLEGKMADYPPHMCERLGKNSARGDGEPGCPFVGCAGAGGGSRADALKQELGVLVDPSAADEVAAVAAAGAPRAACRALFDHAHGMSPGTGPLRDLRFPHDWYHASVDLEDEAREAAGAPKGGVRGGGERSGEGEGAAGSPPRRTRRRHVELELESSSDEDEDEDEDARDLRELREVLERGDTT